ncbi:MAG TPA: ROK family transcriptional regulator [Oligoflexus sp.]|uniref:ROK family transcriptional regulator n=1 Tax=Oligoflexus sp. TaxID=1971216 RepID=UPI002D2201B2|nr:ROK family transcriptional regulator [Oligoflexus sp.]HYX33995.1 ROK family transcriptional regulator [Oligoflexus sp.]
METVDAAHMRAMNCSILLKLIWKHHRISRADISRITSMSRSTVSAIVTELLDRGLVSELGIGPSNGGRRPMMLAFQEDAYSILGLQISAHSISAATLNLNGIVRRWVTQPCDVFQNPEDALALVLKIIDETAALTFSEDMPLIGMALAYPTGGAVDFKGWEETLRERLTIPVHLGYDAHFGAMAELWWNQTVQPRQLGYFQLSETLGFGLLIRDEQKSYGVSGNLGKLLLETETKIQSLYQLIGERAALPRKLSEIFEAAGSGDSAAEAWINAAATPLALTLYNAQALLQLDRMVIGGLWRPQTQRLKILVEGLEEKYGRASAVPVHEWLVPSFRGDQQVALGGGTCVLERVLEDLSLFPARLSMSPLQEKPIDSPFPSME